MLFLPLLDEWADERKTNPSGRHKAVVGEIYNEGKEACSFLSVSGGLVQARVQAPSLRTWEISQGNLTNNWDYQRWTGIRSTRVAKTNLITCKTGTKRCQWPAKRSQTYVQWSQSQFVYIVCYGLLYEGRVIQKCSLKQLLFVYRHSHCNVFERYFLLNAIYMYLNNNLIFVLVPKNPTFERKKISRVLAEKE